MERIKAHTVQRTLSDLREYFCDRVDILVSEGAGYFEKTEGHRDAMPDIVNLSRLGKCPETPVLVLDITSRVDTRRCHETCVSKHEDTGLDEYFIFTLDASFPGEALQSFRLEGEGYRPRYGLRDRLSSRLGFDLTVEGGRLVITDWSSRFPTIEMREKVSATEYRLRAAERSVATAKSHLADTEEKVLLLRGRLKRLLIDAEQPLAQLVQAESSNGNGL